MFTTRRLVAALGVSLSLMGATAARAQGAAHTHTAPHGGEISEVAGHHVEFKADSTGLIQVWVMDEKQKTVAPPPGASVTLIGTGGAQVTLPLEVQAGAQQLTAQFDHHKFASFQAVVKVPLGGKPHNLRFHYPHA
jgi:hypothetical protein